jgi:hypothetical protein
MSYCKLKWITLKSSVKTSNINFRQIRSVGDDLFHTVRWTDRHDEANNRLMQLLWAHASTVYQTSETVRHVSSEVFWRNAEDCLATSLRPYFQQNMMFRQPNVFPFSGEKVVGKFQWLLVTFTNAFIKITSSTHFDLRTDANLFIERFYFFPSEHRPLWR